MRPCPGSTTRLTRSKKEHDEQPDRVLDLILDVAGLLHPFAGVVNVSGAHFSRQGAEERTRALLQALEDAIREHESSIEHLCQRLESPQFVHALTEGVSEAIRTSEQKQIVRFGAVLDHSVAEGTDLGEAAALIRDLAQLTQADIAALRILFQVQADLVSRQTVTTDPNPYTERIQSDVWTDAALRATFRHAYLEGTADKRNPVFVYEVGNTSSRDYAVHNASEVQLFVRHKGALSLKPGLLEIDAPFILPVGEKALLTIPFRAFERYPLGDNDSAAVWHFLSDKTNLWNQFDGIVLMDERHRYRVSLPVGPWDSARPQ